MSKFLLLGLDGATFEMLDPMLETGRLPVLERLLRDGASGTLESTLPPYTCPAWPTMYTGRNPGAHGVFSFRIIPPDSVEGRAATLADVQGVRIWNLLNQAGVRTGIFNVPVTYPAEALDGFMVSGFVTPPNAPQAVEPENKQDAFYAAVPGYDCNGPRIAGQALATSDQQRFFIEQQKENLRTRRRALAWWLREEPVDFLWLVLTTIDRISHPGYGYLVPGSPCYDTDDGKRIREMVLELLEVQDEVIGAALEMMDDPAVMVVSDHGFAHVRKQFDMRTWLIDQGLMVPRRSVSVRGKAKRLVRRAVYAAVGHKAWATLSSMIRRPLGLTPAENPREEIWSAQRQRTWDWARSQAWLGPSMEYGVRVNTTQRHENGVVSPEEYDDVVARIVEGLRDVRDPESGENVFERVERRDDVYEGPYVARAPDVVVLPKRDTAHQTPVSIQADARKGWVAAVPDWNAAGHHDPDGVFAARGLQFLDGDVAVARLYDVTPTVLHAMGVPVPEDLDGRVLEEVFSEAYRRSHPIERTEAAAEGPSSGQTQGYSAEDEAAIARRLEDLGYM